MSAMTRTASGLSTQTGDHWMASAVCRDEDSELFFPIGTHGPAQLQTEQAKAVCRRCPVRTDCLRHAMALNIADGVWGGLSEQERRSRKRLAAELVAL